jgi:peptide/nickel transport system permease protein
MSSLVGRRIFLALVTLFLVSLIVFMGIEALPGDTATAYLGQSQCPPSPTILGLVRGGIEG